MEQTATDCLFFYYKTGDICKSKSLAYNIIRVKMIETVTSSSKSSSSSSSEYKNWLMVGNSRDSLDDRSLNVAKIHSGHLLHLPTLARKRKKMTQAELVKESPNVPRAKE